jgi:hypothetical protein
MVAGVCAVDSTAADVTTITQDRTSTTEARRRALILVIPPVVLAVRLGTIRSTPFQAAVEIVPPAYDV